MAKVLPFVDKRKEARKELERLVAEQHPNWSEEKVKDFTAKVVAYGE